MIDLEIIGEQTTFGNLVYLEEHRFDNGKKFPLSYRNFVKRYGYGLTVKLFIIYIPMDNYPDSWNIRSKEITSTYKEDVENGDIWFDLSPDGSEELIKRLIPFASSENGHYLFWDPETDSEIELDIFITDFKGIGMVKIGRTLDEVIEKLIDPQLYTSVLPFAKKPFPKEFDSWSVPLQPIHI